MTGRDLISVEGSEERGLQPARSELDLSASFDTRVMNGSAPLSSEEASTEAGCLPQRGPREVRGLRPHPAGIDLGCVSSPLPWG